MTCATTRLRLAAVAALAIITAPIAAQQPVVVEATKANDGRFQARVNFADLDLTGDKGIQTLRRRVEHAASIVCEQELGEGTSILVARGCRNLTYLDASPGIAAAVARARSGQAFANSLIIRIKGDKS